MFLIVAGESVIPIVLESVLEPIGSEDCMSVSYTHLTLPTN